MTNRNEAVENFNKLNKGLRISLSNNPPPGINEIILDGYLDTINSEDFRRILQELNTERNPGDVVLNLAQLTYISSMGIGLFVSSIREFKEKGRDLYFLGMRDSVVSVFQTLGFIGFLTRIESLDEIRQADPKAIQTGHPG